jgi:hypothetical protein
VHATDWYHFDQHQTHHRAQMTTQAAVQDYKLPLGVSQPPLHNNMSQDVTHATGVTHCLQKGMLNTEVAATEKMRVSGNRAWTRVPAVMGPAGHGDRRGWMRGSAYTECKHHGWANPH